LSKASTCDVKPLQSTSLRDADSATDPSSKPASSAAPLELSASHGTADKPAPAETHVATPSSSRAPSEPDSKPAETTESSDLSLLKVEVNTEQPQALASSSSSLLPEQPVDPLGSNSIILEETAGSSNKVSPETHALSESQTDLPSTPTLDAEEAALEALRTLEEYTRALHQRALQAQEANERHYAMQLALEDWITATEEQQQIMRTGIKSMKDLVAARPGGSRQTRRRSDDDGPADLDNRKKSRIAAI
jgi:hypothetical protein